MEELVGALLYAIVEILGEVFFELIGEAITTLVLRSIRNFAGEVNAVSPVLAGAGYLLLGAGFGVLSVYLFPHALMHRSRFHGISLLVSPLLTGFVMSQVGLRLRQKGKDSAQIESFGYGFTFALGVAVIRFFFVS